MVCKTDLGFFYIILLQYYSNAFIVVGGLLLVIFGTASIYKCSAATEFGYRVCTIRKIMELFRLLGENQYTIWVCFSHWYGSGWFLKHLN